MKICIISDVHRVLYAHQYVKELVPDANVYVDCGDSEYGDVDLYKLKEAGWVCVKGNNDYTYDLEDERIFTYAGYTFLVIHGHRMPSRIWNKDVDIILRGHTHRYSVEKKGKKLVINPDSFSRPTDLESGLGEFCILHIDEDKTLSQERIIINHKEINEYKGE